mmetsp:Transcript_28034/g.64906  ORF Transcript_28034/g.64906 Transcript_28034/m.64906 type:complete len:209 (+) Transcript_28034:835-1461(+)
MSLSSSSIKLSRQCSLAASNMLSRLSLKSVVSVIDDETPCPRFSSCCNHSKMGESPTGGAGTGGGNTSSKSSSSSSSYDGPSSSSDRPSSLSSNSGGGGRARIWTLASGSSAVVSVRTRSRRLSTTVLLFWSDSFSSDTPFLPSLMDSRLTGVSPEWAVCAGPFCAESRLDFALEEALNFDLVTHVLMRFACLTKNKSLNSVLLLRCM